MENSILLNRFINIFLVVFCLLIQASAFSIQETIRVPAGFEDIFSTKHSGVFEIMYNNQLIGFANIIYNHHTVEFDVPQELSDLIINLDAAILIPSKEQLTQELTQPILIVNSASLQQEQITVQLNQTDLLLTLLLPARFFDREVSKNRPKSYLTPNKQAGLIQVHNFNLINDTRRTIYNISFADYINFNGYSYIHALFNYNSNHSLQVQDLAFFLEYQNKRMVAGRQDIYSSLQNSLPSTTFNLPNSVSFDGISFGYSKNNYINSTNINASPISVYLPSDGIVEVYKQGSLISVQHLLNGFHYLNTNSWPYGNYPVVIITKLNNGSEEVTTQPFRKRGGITAIPNEHEYLFQGGLYYSNYNDPLRNLGIDCPDCIVQDTLVNKNNRFVSAYYARTILPSLLSFGTGLTLNNSDMLVSSSLNLPINLGVTEWLNLSGILAHNRSYMYQFDISKDFGEIGYNLSYNMQQFFGNKLDYNTYSISPTLNSSYLQLGTSLRLPYQFFLIANYNHGYYFYDYAKTHEIQSRILNVSLSRHFRLSHAFNLNTSINYSKRERNQLIPNINQISTTPEHLFGATASLNYSQSNNSYYQFIGLRADINRNYSTQNLYYSAKLMNPNFDQASIYSFNSNLTHGNNQDYGFNGSLNIDSPRSVTGLGISSFFYEDGHNQVYTLNHMGSLAIGNKTFAFGKADAPSAIIIDASDVPTDGYFEITNGFSSTSIQGGSKTLLSVYPYTRVAPIIKQIFSDNYAQNNYTVKPKINRGWITPGQAYYLKLEANKTVTITGRIFNQTGQPLVEATIVGANAVTDQEGFFVGELSTGLNDELHSLKIMYKKQTYTCPLIKENIHLIYNILQLKEVQCEI